MLQVFIRTNSSDKPFIETVSNFSFDAKGNLSLFDKGKRWFFPYTNLQYVFIDDLEADYNGRNN